MKSLRIKVAEVKGCCPVYSPGDKFTIFEGYKLRAEREVCMHALASFLPLIAFVQDRPGHDRRYTINPAKAQAALSWQPQTAFATGLTDLIAWHTTHRPWVESVRSEEYREYAAKWYGGMVI